MDDCQAHGIAVLEFEQVRQSVASYAGSQEGGNLVREAWPCFSLDAHLGQKTRVETLARMLEADLEFPPISLPPVLSVLERLPKEGLCLDQEELFALGAWADAVQDFLDFFRRNGERFKAQDLAEGLSDCSKARAIVFSVLNKDGSLKDLPEFREIRRNLSRLRSDIDSLIASYFQDEHKKAMLQNELPTLKDGRTVLAVKANFKGRIRGIVHEVSATGQTVYLEPEDVLEKNNQLVREEARLAQEILRVLKETSAKLRPEAGTLSQAVDRLAYLDSLLARARYSHANRNNPIESPLSLEQSEPSTRLAAPGREAGLSLIQARHPLLGSRAVPIDLSLDASTRILIISGPNTGGKTVSLKTLGLFALMHQFGLRLPCKHGSRLPFYSGVYADIGDEQSLSQSLSTFSAHMKNISGIVAKADSSSLVLLDELGSGTDPEEGSAIAMALLDRLLDVGAQTLLTSHHGILKNYGYSKAGCQNASVDFNGQTLSPTYRILMGIPGESHALDIAQRNGLDLSIVENARSYLDKERADVSVLIRGLKDKHLAVEELEVERRSRLKDAMEEQRKASLKDLRLRQKELELKTLGAQELRRLLSESRKGLENLVRELKEGELSKEKTLRVKEFISELEKTSAQEEEKLRAFEAELREAEKSQGEDSGGLSIEPGADVLYGKARKRAKVIRPAKKGFWLIETEMMKLTVPESELVPTQALAAPKPQVSISLSPHEGPRALFQLDLRGMRLEEALKAVERQIDEAALSGLHEFGVIHGLGEGVLQKGIREYLSRSPAVADFDYARPEEGGFGKTNVKLRA